MDCIYSSESFDRFRVNDSAEDRPRSADIIMYTRVLVIELFGTEGIPKKPRRCNALKFVRTRAYLYVLTYWSSQSEGMSGVYKGDFRSRPIAAQGRPRPRVPSSRV